MRRWASQEDLKRVHRPEYVDDHFREKPGLKYGQLDPERVRMNTYTLGAARRLRGKGIFAVAELRAGPVGKAFARFARAGQRHYRGRPRAWLVNKHGGPPPMPSNSRPRGVAIVEFESITAMVPRTVSAPRWQDRVMM